MLARLLSRLALPVALGSVLVAAGGCAPACGTLCDKLDGCDLRAQVDRQECIDACDRQLGDLTAREDTDGLEAFDAQRTCLGASTCEEIAEGVCWDDTLGPFALSEGS